MLNQNVPNLTILSANGTNMKATSKGQLQPLNTLSPSAQAAIVLDDLKTGMLISLSQLCDDDCQTWCKNHQTEQSYHLGQMWAERPMVNTNIANACATGKWHSQTQQDKIELANYHHALLGSPTKSTLHQAICQGHLTTNYQAHIQTSSTYHSHRTRTSRPRSKTFAPNQTRPTKPAQPNPPNQTLHHWSDNKPTWHGP